MYSCHAGEAKPAAAEAAELPTPNGKAAEPEAAACAVAHVKPEPAAVKEMAEAPKAAPEKEEAAAPEAATAAGKDEAAAEKVEEKQEQAAQFVPGLLVRFDFGDAEHDLSYEDIKGAFGRAMAHVEFQKARCSSAPCM